MLNPAAARASSLHSAAERAWHEEQLPVHRRQSNNNDNLQTRINQTISSKDGLDVNFNYQHRNSETSSPSDSPIPPVGMG